MSHGRNQYVLELFKPGSCGLYLQDDGKTLAQNQNFLYQMGYEPQYYRGLRKYIKA